MPITEYERIHLKNKVWAISLIQIPETRVYTQMKKFSSSTIIPYMRCQLNFGSYKIFKLDI